MEEEFKKAYNYCIYILSKRDYSTHKIRQKLKERKHTPELIETIIEDLVEKNYLREEEYKRQRIKQHILRGYANSFIIQKLNQEKLTAVDEEIDALRSEQDLHATDIIEYLIEKKLRGKEIPTEWEDRQKLKAKVLRFLISKGHTYSDISTKLNKRLS